MEITVHRFKTYLDWRFYIRQKQSDQNIEELVQEIKELGFQKIGKIDEVIKNSTEVLKQYENEQFSKLHFDGVGAVRICIGLHYSDLGQKRSSKYFISEFDKYNNLARDRFIPEYTIKMVRK